MVHNCVRERVRVLVYTCTNFNHRGRTACTNNLPLILDRAEDAVAEALSLWEERERTRAEILCAVDSAETALARGEGRVIVTEQDARNLANEVKKRGRERFDAEQARLR